jgi:type IX secretion system PorP/SprF family membrane protein
MRLISYIFVVILLGNIMNRAEAQQLPILSEYFHSPTLLNPAMTGWEDITAVTAAYRHQWAEMQGNPITANLNFRHFSPKYNMAFGGGIMHDQTGPTSFTGISLQYAYHLQFKSEKNKQEKRNRLSIGLSLSANQYRLQGDKLRYNDANDALIINNTGSQILPDAGLGVFYYNDQYFVGIAVPQLISMKVKFESDNALSAIQRIAHFYLNAGAKIELRDASQGATKKSLKEQSKHLLMPSMWVKYAPTSPLNVHLNIRYMWKQTLGIGLGASTDGTAIADISVQIKKRFRVGYAFSIPLNELSPQLGTNHEIMLTYVFGSGGNGWMFEQAPQQLGKKQKEK